MAVGLTDEAAEVLRKVQAKHGKVYMIIGDTGCCGYSNVFLTRNRPVGDYVQVGETIGTMVYLRPPLSETLDPSSVVVDVVEAVADDSLSLETELGYRFILRVKLG
ncbi:MAG: DUF779 domain-containing protein [Aigarchaeota archaeon]|nr:DUF779 domain-containing protein [Candidatus Calditenuaceae archaeon]